MRRLTCYTKTVTDKTISLAPAGEASTWRGVNAIRTSARLKKGQAFLVYDERGNLLRPRMAA